MPARPPFRSLHGALARVRRDETGAEAVEFAIAGPVALFLIAGVIYLVMAVAAQVSLHHGASVGVRYASIPTDPVATTYPSATEVEARLDDATWFFTADSCTTLVDGDEIQNAPVDLDVTCTFPNPLGAAMNGLQRTFTDSTGGFSDTFDMSARAKARRE